jgi:hypothetical protein
METPAKMQAVIEAIEELRVAAEAEKEQLIAMSSDHEYFKVYVKAEACAQQCGETLAAMQAGQ